MLFNSYPFLLGFFPIVLIGFAVLQRRAGEAPYRFLLAASLFFYGWWDVRFLPLLVGSFTVNYFGGRAILAARTRGQPVGTGVLTTLFIALNLVTLGLLKYANFVVANVNAVFGSDISLGAIVLPLGISFFTFEQISFLVDVGTGRTTPKGFLSYALFVSFFPRLVAGPILRYDEIVSQFSSRAMGRESWENLAIGLSIFTIGLVKKSVLADGIAPYVRPAFDAAAHGQSVDFLVAWGGALAYTCQLYFDFSGYSDMAIGAARCLGLRFPMNFDSPYKSTNIIEFWRRWHMTLSRFLRDYLYFALGGNRRGKMRRYANLMITMLLGGLWHGASWTFIAWGGLHGAYLVLNHGWIALAERYPVLAAFRKSRGGRSLGFALTFLAVVVAWVFFRAPTFAAAFDLIRAMSFGHGVVVPEGLAFALVLVHSIVTALGIRFGETSGSEFIMSWLWIATLLAIAFFLPNTQELMARFEPVLERVQGHRLAWVPNGAWAAVIGIMAFVGFASVTRVSEFLYWQF